VIANQLVAEVYRRDHPSTQETAMPLNPKESLEAVRDVAVHSVEKASDIVDNAADIVRGEVTEGIAGIVANSIDIGTHAVEKVKEIITGNSAEDDDDPS
jgi:hypothetical protein